MKRLMMMMAFASAMSTWADAVATKSVQEALDKVFPGWTTSENAADLGPGLRRPPNANGAWCDSVMTHPMKDGHATLSRQIALPAGLPILKVKASADPRGDGDWEFMARVDGVTVVSQRVTRAKMMSVEIPLAKWAGKTAKVELVNAVNGWNYENAYWHQIEVVDGRRTLKGPQIKGMKVGGHIGMMMDRHFANAVAKKDADLYASVFCKDKIGKKPGWAGEYWGKWLMTAVQAWEYSGNPEIKAKMDRTVAYVIANQYPDGYIGDIPAKVRFSTTSWDLWCRKYSLFGMLEYYRATGDKRVLEACCRLVDNLMRDVGPGKLDICLTGTHHGFASQGILQTVSRLYTCTGDQKYRDYARYIATQLEEGPKAAHLVSNAVAGKIPSAYSEFFGGMHWMNSCKSYEMSTCYIGLLDFFRLGEDAKYRQAAVNYGDAVARTEIMLTGSGNTNENWFRGEARQTLAPLNPHEGCTKATWMHLCRELLESTGDARWADEFEKTFLNGYLASYSPDCSRFEMYMQTFGRRGHDNIKNQCGLPTHCCNEIGPHGFIDLMNSVALTDGDAVYVAQYVPGKFTLTRKTGTVEIVEATDYPASGRIKLTVNPSQPARFAVKVRTPGWLGGGASGWRTYEREWKAGDTIELDFPMKLKAHHQNGWLAFTVGPVLLARDSRYNDGDLAEQVRIPGGKKGKGANLRVDPNPHPGRWLSYVLTLQGEDAIAGFDDVKVKQRDYHFCDFSSAANSWTSENRCRTWLPSVFVRPVGD